jgi:hypothetical protein
MRIGVPMNPNSSRSLLIKKRSYEKWKVVATLVKKTNDGGMTPICAAYMTRTCFRPGLTGGFDAVTASTNLFSTGVGTRWRLLAAILSMVSRTLVVRSPVSAEICRMGA